jgi:hypothetical protein
MARARTECNEKKRIWKTHHDLIKNWQIRYIRIPEVPLHGAPHKFDIPYGDRFVVPLLLPQLNPFFGGLCPEQYSGRIARCDVN